MERDQTGADPSPRAAWLRYLPLAAVGAALVAVFATGAHRALSFDAVVASRAQLQAVVAEQGLRALAAFVAVYALAVTLSIPGAVFLTILGGFLFGWLVGGLAAVAAGTAGAIGVFLVARTSVGDALVRRAGPRLQSLAEGFRRDAFSYLLFLRVVPLVPFWVTNLAPALFGVPLRTHALTTAVGIIPGTMAYAAAGAGLDSLIAAQQQGVEACRAAGRADCGYTFSLASVLTPELVAALVLLGLAALVPVVLKRRRLARAAAPDA